MKVPSVRLDVVAGVVILGCLATASAAAQKGMGGGTERTRDYTVPQPTQSIQQTRDMPTGALPRFDEHVDAYLRQAQAKEWQKKIAADSKKMVDMAAAVNVAASQTQDGKPTAELVKRAGDLEKLAHSIAGRLKDQH